jgi:hypothetical protein
MGSYLCWTLGVVAGLVGAPLGVLVFWHNLRIWRLRRIYKALPPEVKDQVLSAIRTAAANRQAVTLLRLDDRCAPDPQAAVIQSHVGGLPYAEHGESWPKESKFIVQVCLDERSQGAPWQGRLLTVFLLVADFEQVVRSYAVPSLDKRVPLDPPVDLLPLVLLTSLPIPADDQQRAPDGGIFPAPPARLCEMVPAIRDILSPFTSDAVGLLAQILYPGVYGYDLETPDIAYEGGEPMLIQNPHEPTCQKCARPMRFLFQFGDIIPGLQMADAGVCYVYGCDEHPDICTAFVDSH